MARAVQCAWYAARYEALYAVHYEVFGLWLNMRLGIEHTTGYAVTPTC